MRESHIAKVKQIAESDPRVLKEQERGSKIETSGIVFGEATDYIDTCNDRVAFIKERIDGIKTWMQEIGQDNKDFKDAQKNIEMMKKELQK